MTRRELFKKLVVTPFLVGIGTVAATPVVKYVFDRYLVDNEWFLVYGGKRPIEEGKRFIWNEEKKTFDIKLDAVFRHKGRLE